MKKCSWIFLAILFSVSGCVINSTRELPQGGVASEDRAVIVYGVQMEGPWEYAGFDLQLAEYNLKAEQITGNCLTFNRTDARVPSTPGETKYFAFDVPAGHYVYSPFNSTELEGGVRAFEAPPWQSVYIGDFIYQKNKTIKLRRNLTEAQSAIDKALPGLNGHLTLAKAMPAKATYIFVCTP
ncbi:hypothetical protein [Rugamonas rivuli]|uniref:Uncharacterized protein n=1 Tax=Rugamonas rivuli TaxID=2743358 RepID=A0A843SPB5_9BURK|nr:hypothetical protein [Rugamonas rivuli]MQA22096.1 hypothetical protein [Rugamonas rivuli]